MSRILETIEKKSDSLEVVKLFNEPDGNFPNGVPNPMIEENRLITSQKIIESKADIGIAFDGDFDRCFFFDERGSFISGEYICGLLASIFLKKEPGATIIHDPRIIFFIGQVIQSLNGVSEIEKTGHVFFKSAMRKYNAVYGGEVSAHHYFRDFMFCDSGMIPWLLILELMSKTNKSLSSLIKYGRENYLSSGEINITSENADNSIEKVLRFYEKDAVSMSFLDGISVSFPDWRFNLRKSNTEPLIRLNIETKTKKSSLDKRVREIRNLVGCGKQ